jgi:hypothetical protein
MFDEPPSNFETRKQEFFKRQLQWQDEVNQSKALILIFYRKTKTINGKAGI